jgi:hypothetical protein
MNVNSCPHSEKILDYVLGLLSEQEQEDFKIHVQGCPLCQHELNLEITIGDELRAELQPGYIEERVCAKLKVHQTLRVGFSWLYALRMAVYGVTAMVLALVLPPIILRFPIGRDIDFAAFVSSIATIVHRALPSVQLSFFVGGVGTIFMVASVAYSLAYLRK